MRPLDIRKDIAPSQEEHDAAYTQNRLSSLTWVTRLTILVILIAITQIVLNSIHLSWHSLPLVKALLGTSIAFLITGFVIFYWSRQSSDAYKSSGELFQPRVNERFTKVVFIGSLLLAGTALVLWVNLLVQKAYPEDYVAAQLTSSETWQNSFNDSSSDSIISFFNGSFITQLVFHGILFFYFAFVARTAFKCLKWDNQAISQLVFVGCVLLLAFGLCLIFFSYHALNYGDYPQVKAHFPTWNLRSLFFIGVILSFLSFVGFLADHRSWRIGFLILGFLLLFGLVLLVNFTGFAYRHTKSTYNYYKGSQSIETCINRLPLVDAETLQSHGCPAKYLASDQCAAANRVTVWENYNPHREGAAPKASKQTAEAAPIEETPAETTPAEETPAETTPVEETPAETTPAEETPAEETPAETTPVEETSETTPAETTPAEETSEAAPAEETAETTPAETTPTEETEGEETAPVVQPTGATNATNATQPATVEGETEETEEPAATPAEETAETTPVETTPVEETAETIPAEETAETTPAETTPAEETESEETAPVVQPTGATNATQPATTEGETEETEEPAETAPVETPAEETPAETTPAEETPAETTPVEETSETPASTETTTPAETTPAEETEDETTPVVENPAAHTNTTNATHATTTPGAEGETEETEEIAEFTLLTDEYVDAGSYCVNTNCCGILGEVYAEDLLTVANFGLLTIIAGILILIGCAYFWYVNWIDSARRKGRDYIYLAIMVLLLITFIIIQTQVTVTPVPEKVGSGGVHQ